MTIKGNIGKGDILHMDVKSVNHEAYSLQVMSQGFRYYLIKFDHAMFFAKRTNFHILWCEV